jgi:aldose 1-epimerase
MSHETLPTHRAATHGLDVDLVALDVDHCFDGWSGMLQLRDELLHTRITSPMSRLVVFTNATKSFVAIEPVSHVNNALNMLALDPEKADELGANILQPGESMTAQMTIEVTTAT